jgi:uncharacterized protein (TIGR03083 family)
MDYLSSLASDYQRLAEVSAGHLADQVPTCPEWTVDDLVRHVATVYLHKVECMRLNALPDPWPPDVSAEPALDLLSRAHVALTAELTSRDPGSPAWTWYGPDQTAGFWARRMAQETVIHRIDGELAAGVASRAIPDDLAVDGIDEVLRIFLAWASQEWLEDFAAPLSKGDGSVLVQAGGQSWLVSWDSTGVTAEPGAGSARAEITGTPDALLRWLWRRAGDDSVEAAGDVAKVAQLRALLEPATQ